MKHSCILLIFFTLLPYDTFALGQYASQTRNKKPRTPDEYQTRTLKAITALKPDSQDLRDKQNRLVITADVLPSRVRVSYTGEIRSILSSKKEIVRQWARLYAGSIEHYTEPYQTEMRFVENGASYWIGIPKNSLLAKQTFRKDEELDLYVIRLGAAVEGDEYAWTLLVEDFREAESSRSSAEISFRAMRLGRPPLVYMTFDVLLRNDYNSPRWFLIPSNLGPGHGAIGEKGGVDNLEVFIPHGEGRVIIGRFLGTGGFHAVLLAPHAEVRLRQFPISFWGDPPDRLQIEVVIARQLTIGGENAETWFGLKAVSGARADISENAESVTRLVHSKRSHDNKEVLPLIEEDRRFQVRVSLEPKE